MNQSKSLSQSRTALAVNPPAIDSLAQGSMFWKPDYLRPSVWLEHLPFLFWAVEALQPAIVVTAGVKSGVGHFGVCQAVQRLRLGTSCYGIAPHLDNALIRFGEQAFGTFAHSLQEHPVVAAGRFGEGSVDLLLISGDEANLPHLFESWKPRLSAKAIVLISGVTKREAGQQAAGFFESMSAEYPCAVFNHGGGLGVLAVGSDPNPLMAHLFETAQTASAMQVIRDIFARLGHSCLDRLHAEGFQKKVHDLEESLEAHQYELIQLNEDYEATRKQLSRRHDDVSRVEQSFERAAERQVQEVRQLTQLLESERARRADADKANETLVANCALLAGQLEAEREALTARITHQSDRLETANQDTHALRTSEIERFDELTHLTAFLEAERARRESAEQALAAAVAAAKAEAGRVAQVQDELATADTKLTAMESRLSTSDQALKKTGTELSALQAERNTLRQQVRALQQHYLVLEQRLETGTDELVVLTALLEGDNQTSREDTGTAAFGQSGKPVAKAGRGVLRRFSVFGKANKSEKKQLAMIVNNELFDAKWYLAQYPDVAAHGDFARQPARHYLQFGGFEERNPGPRFDSAFYLANNDDVRESGINPLLHYLQFGKDEGREPVVG